MFAATWCLAVFSLSGCAGAASLREPLNLTIAKEAVVEYVDSGAYDQGILTVATEAREWLETRAARRRPEERLAVVFDIDETVLSNYAHMKSQDFGYVPDAWNAWVASASAPAIAPVKTLYDAARQLGLEVIFITGRRDPRDRPGTEENLRREGMGDYARLIMSSAGSSRTAEAEKSAARAALEQEGWTLIASIGDQQSDLAGGHVERIFKLPNPVYFTP